MMHCHGGTNNRVPRWTFMDPWKLVKFYKKNTFF